MKKSRTITLKEYLSQHNLEIKSFAERIGYSREHLSNVINGHNKPSRHMAIIIEMYTDGEVKL